MNLSRNGIKEWLSTAGLALALAGASVLASCKYHEDPRFTEGRVFAGGVEADAQKLNDGHDAYMLYCYACHGTKGDGHGPASYGLRPPPRDFTKGIFKFARLRSSDDMPNDEDLHRIVKGGLHGTAMLAWDVPDIELDKIFQYIKTLGPEKVNEDGTVEHLPSKWEKKKNGEPIKVLDPWEAGKDPWDGNVDAAVLEGKKLYHFRAECLNCHPAYGGKEELYKLSVQAAKERPETYKPMTGFRDDPYGSVAKDSAEYAQKILPPDFIFMPVRSVRPGTDAEQVADLVRIISFGVYPIMPAWKDAGLTDKDIWALAHYVQTLVAIQGTTEALAMKTKFQSQGAFEVPKPAEPPPAQEEKKDEPPPPAKDEKKDVKKPAPPKGDGK